MDKQTGTDSDPDSDLITSAAETPEQLAARKVELEAQLKVAIAEATQAEFEAQAACYALRDLQWINTADGHDVQTWGDIVEAIAALPSDATDQQIALAQARAIFVSKSKRLTALPEQFPAAQDRVAAAIKIVKEKERAIEAAQDALEDLDPKNKKALAWAPMSSAAWLFGKFGNLGNKLGKG